jgi:hypothetical protein
LISKLDSEKRILGESCLVMTKRFFNSKYVEKVGKISSKKSEKYQNVLYKKGYKYFSNQTLMERSTNFEG